MENSDETLREQVRHAWQAGVENGQPSFATVWQAAEDRRVAGRRYYRRFASVAVLLAAVAIAFNVQAPPESYIELADLLESTYWSAPSDVLLPDREFDIYQDMPVLFESTEPAGGALL